MTIRPPDGCGAGRRSSFRCGASFFMAVGAHASFLIRLVMSMPQEGALARRGCAIRTFLEHISRPTQRFPTPPQVRCPAVPHALQHGLLIRIIPMLTRPGLCNTTTSLHIYPGHPGCSRGCRTPPIPAPARPLGSDNAFRRRQSVIPIASKYSLSGS